MENIIETPTEINYKVKERVGEYIKKHGSAEEAYKVLEKENAEYQDLWGLYSGDGLGHAITCTNLMIRFIEKHLTN